MFQKNDNGFSLVSVMVSIGLAGGLALFLMELSQQQSKQHKKAVVDSELIEIFGQFNRMISKADSCKATFVGLQRGDSFLEFRYSFDENAEPFAMVGKKFRNTNLTLVEMKLLEDKDNNRIYDDYENAPDPLRVDNELVVLKVTFARPEGLSGAKQISKTFDVPVAIGSGEMVTGKNVDAVLASCKGDPVDKNKCIASFDTYECAQESDAEKEMIPTKNGLMGYCFDKDPEDKQKEYVLHCTTSKD